jgi:hypothetical protein
MIEVDPDFWLATRLARGSGLQRVLNYAALPLGLTTWMVLRRLDPNPYTPWSYFEPGQLLGLMLFAPILIPLRLADYDRRGLLDLIRLNGRNPKRVLIGFLGGLMAPLIWIVPVLLVFRIWIDLPQGDLTGGLLVAAGALELELITFGVLSFRSANSSWRVSQLSAPGRRPRSALRSEVRRTHPHYRQDSWRRPSWSSWRRSRSRLRVMRWIAQRSQRSRATAIDDRCGSDTR